MVLWLDLEYLNSKVEGAPREKLLKYFRFIAGNRMAECTAEGIPILSKYKDGMLGDNLELTESILIDSYNMSMAGQGSECKVSLENSVKVCRLLHLGYSKLDSASIIEDFYGNCNNVDSSIEQSGEDVPDVVWDDSEDATGEVDLTSDAEDEEPVEESAEEDSGLKEEDVNRYYAQFANGVIQELIKRYTAMFSSGYEVVKPAGILCKDGIVRVSGSHRSVYEDSIATTNIYGIVKSNLPFTEVPTRSIVGIANAIYNNYSSGVMLYFPNKMLEFAYGLEAPTGENQESLNTYTRHAKASNWSSFCSSELEKSVKLLVKKSMYWYVKNVVVDGDYKSNEVANGLSSFLKYLQDCLSVCILFPEYKITNVNGEKDVASFKLRVCDPTGSLMMVNLTPQILTNAFLGGKGKIPFSYDPRVEVDNYLVEYIHEFNHDLAQATPLFAYKALENLLADGKGISWDNLILGQGIDGKIVKGGPGGIDLLVKLFHHIIAGSRAGKGVMTLNLLASAAAAMKSVLYVDRKPDMASILKFISPDMFVFNGGGYEAQYDTEKQWTPEMVDAIATKNVPDEVYKAFGVLPTWDSLGDLFYMRAVKLIVGIIIARGSGKFNDPAFGGEKGIMVVLDEFKNFQNSFRGLLKNASGYIPSTVMEKARDSVADGKMTQATFDRYYSNAGYYALSYMNSLVEDMNIVSSKQDAGFNQSEIAMSDIFIIGQDVNNGPMDKSIFSEYFRNSSGSGRYRMADNMGVKGFNIEGMSVPYTLINFKPADAFFGRNMDDGHSVYLAQTDRRSKAYGRLDDKASNFAFMESYTEDKRKKILQGRSVDNIELADSCRYFKPYLILNDSRMDGDCVQGVFRRCMDSAGITPEEIIAQNPDNDNPNSINKAVGFLDYIQMAGVGNYSEVFAEGSKIAQHVVDLLGYPGSWFEFLCDLRPEWMFTIRDIDDVAKGKVPALANPATNPILEEYVAFNPGRFGSEYVSETEASENAMDAGFFTDSTAEDFSNEDVMQSSEDERMKDLFDEGNDVSDDELEDILRYDSSWAEEFDYGSDEEDDIQLNEANLHETGHVGEEAPKGYGYGSSSPEEDTQEQILSLIRQLEALGVNIQVSDEPEASNDAEPTEFGEEVGSINYQDDIVSLEMLMKIVSDDLVSKFGGLGRITNFKVIGGSIIVNGYYYRCRIKDLYAKNIPYDIRRDINSGNVSKLFNYFLLYRMHSIHSLEFDSLEFTHDYVSSEMGIRGNIGVDRFFESLPTLQTLTIAGKKFTRSSYVAEAGGEDIFYRPRRSTQIADATENWFGRATKSSWGFTKRIATNRNCGKVMRVLGTVGGVGATAAAGTAAVGTKATRKAVKGIKILSNSIKGLINN